YNKMQRTMKNLTATIFSLALLVTLTSSKPAEDTMYLTRTGHIWFYNKPETAGTEEVEGHNRQVSSALNTATGKVMFSMLIKSFEFKKALMQEHFNEKYMESDKFPKSTFDGTIDNFDKGMMHKDGTYKVTASGKLTIHGTTKEVKLPAALTIKGNTINAKSDFR